ncbi:hypothetical protein E2C01_020652 [Portunus trituberculatus]|uniref:Uncharacterized protein n=1 Tax=Portunus trituberculatus TaxID=210409 RepID=A0A5B7E0G5_PORTR|nr:hypothetical protein [Portunus trituberculatus]
MYVSEVTREGREAREGCWEGHEERVKRSPAKCSVDEGGGDAEIIEGGRVVAAGKQTPGSHAWRRMAGRGAALVKGETSRKQLFAPFP